MDGRLEMRRETFNAKKDSSLIFHAPLTTTGTDLVGGKTPTVSGSIAYTLDGVRLQNSSLLKYSFTPAEALSAKTIYCEIMPYTQVNTYDYAYMFGHYYNNTPNFRAAICRMQSGGYIYLTMSRSSNRYDADMNTYHPFPLGTHKKLTFVFEPSAQRLYSDGMLIWSGSGTDTWNGWGYSYLLLTLGGTGHSARSFNGYIRNFMIFNRALTAQEIAML